MISWIENRSRDDRDQLDEEEEEEKEEEEEEEEEKEQILIAERYVHQASEYGQRSSNSFTAASTSPSAPVSSRTDRRPDQHRRPERWERQDLC